MKDLKEAIDKLTEKVTSLEAELHVAKESFEPNYNAIEKWVLEEFAPEFKQETISEMADYVEGWVTEEFAPEVQNWVLEEFAPEVQSWVCEEFAPEVQNWVLEEFAPEVQNWICEEFAPEVQNWICEEFAPEVQNWVLEEFSPTVESWLNEEFTPETVVNAVNESVNSRVTELENRINENVNSYLEAQKDNRFVGIDKMLESLAELDSKDAALEALTEAQKKDTTFAGYFAIENMPAQYRPSWESLNESRKIEIARQSKMYDFTKMGILESFWAGVKFENKPTQITESVNVVNNYHNSIAAQMKKMMHK
jgi:peptidyl-tRNA hydrolase